MTYWDSLGRHFFKMDFSHADHVSGLGNKSFIAELMPRQPLYTCLLTEQAQAVIGKAHPNAVPARRILCNEGFPHPGYIDLFDGGPVIEAHIPKIRAVRDSQSQATTTGGCRLMCQAPVMDASARTESQILSRQNPSKAKNKKTAHGGFSV